MSEPTDYLRVSYSSLNTASSCWRKFEFDKLYPKRVRDSDMYAADTGKALHAGYQSWLTNQDYDEAMWQFMLAFPFEGEFQQTNDYRGFEACMSTLDLMIESVKLHEYELAKIKRPLTMDEIAAGITELPTVPAIEVPFEIRFKGVTLPDGRGISFIGYIDAIMRHYMTGNFRTLDIKTTRMSVKDATAKFKFDTQQVPYGLVIDHVAQGEVDAYEVLYFDCYIDLLAPRVELYPFMKNRTDIQEWAINKVMQVEQIQRFMTMDYFPRTEGGCMFYNSPCRYLEVCGSRDRDAVTEWLLLGGEAAQADEFQPWITVDVEVG